MPVSFLDALGLSAKMDSELVGSSPRKDVNKSGDKLKHERSTTDDSLWDGVDRHDEMIQKQEQRQKQENNDQPLSPSIFSCGRIISDNGKKDEALNAKPRNIFAAVTPTKEEEDDEMSFSSLYSDEVENDDASSSPLFACGGTTCDPYETSDDEASFILSTTNAKQRKAATTIQNSHDDDDEMTFEDDVDQSSYSGSLVMLSEKIPEHQERVVDRHSNNSSSSEKSNPLVDESRSQNSGGQTMRKDGSPSVDEPQDVIIMSSLPVVEREQEQEPPAPSASTKNRIWKKKSHRGLFLSFKKTSKKKSADALMPSKTIKLTTPAKAARGLNGKVSSAMVEEKKGNYSVVLFEQVYESDYRGRLIAKTNPAELVGSID